jgi:hypothetical protein
LSGGATTSRRLRGDGGQVAGVEVLPFGVLVFVVGSLVVTNAWAVVDTKTAVDAATREAVRRYVEAPDAPTGEEDARRAAGEVAEAQGRRADHLALTIEHEADRPFARCVRVTVEARYPVPALRLPWIGGLGGGFEVRARHSERIDPFRSGLPGVGTC